MPFGDVGLALVARGPGKVLRDAGPRGRRLLGAAVLACAFGIGVRVAAGKLLEALLYHPQRYAQLRGHEQWLGKVAIVLKRFSYRLDTVSYVLTQPSAWRLLSRGSAQKSSEGLGLSQRAYLIQPQDGGPGSAGLWVFFGGNAMVGTDFTQFCTQVLNALAAQGNLQQRPAFLLIDYPGYGANDGQPSPASVLATQLAALRAALPRLGSGVPAGGVRVNLLGHSLGAAAAAQLAVRLAQLQRGQSASEDKLLADVKLGRMVLSAPFWNIGAMAQEIFGKRVFPSWLLRLLLAQRWENDEWVPEAAQAGWDVAIIFGSQDEIVPTWMSRALKDAVQSRSRQCHLVELRDAGHNDLLDRFSEYVALMGLLPDETLSAHEAAL